MLTTFQQFASSSPDWLTLLILLCAVLPLLILPLAFLGLLGANHRNKVRAYMRFSYLFLPWLPFAALAGAFIMSLSNALLGSLVMLCFVGVRIYFILANAGNNGLKNNEQSFA